MVTISSILNYLDDMHIRYEYVGNENLKIMGISSLNNPKPESITWIKKIDEFDITMLDASLNRLVVANITEKDIPDNYNFIFCDNPKEVFFTLLDKFWNNTPELNSISPSSVVLSENIGENVSIGAGSFIDKYVSIGNNTVIMNNVSIEGDVKIGNNVLIHSGVVIGSDGFGFFQDEKKQYRKVPHYGGVIIGNNVEICANTEIEKSTLDNTIIGNNVKIGANTCVGHNVHIEDNCCICAGVLLMGSVFIGKNSYLAPGTSIMNQIKIGEGVMVGLSSLVTKDIPANCKVFGIPARIIERDIN